MTPRIPDNILTLLVTITGAVLPPRDPNDDDDEDEEDEEDAVSDVVMHLLEVPDILAGLGLERHQRARPNGSSPSLWYSLRVKSAYAPNY
jgi:hypothetical protein